MAQSGYFDIPSESGGFTWRTYYEESGGRVSITNVNLQSRTFTGPTWYPGGKIAVNGETVLNMSYDSPATHAFNVFGASDTFVGCQVLSAGQAFPVISGPVVTGKAEITVDVELYRNADTSKHKVSGSFTIDVASVLAMIHDGAEFLQKQAVASDGTAFKKYRPIIHDGATWSK